MNLNIIVCIKSVVFDAPKGRVVRTPESCELNPFDRPALEVALHLRQAHGGEVTTMSMGPEVSALALIETMALGVDRSILISDPALAGSDTLALQLLLRLPFKNLPTLIWYFSAPELPIVTPARSVPRPQSCSICPW